jgi:hypothetical protein
MPIQFGGGSPCAVLVDLSTIQFPTAVATNSDYRNFHVDPDYIGIEFYGKTSSDSFKFTNTVFTSATSYYWKFNAAHSASAILDFSGSSVINATVTMVANAALSEVNFISCGAITHVGNTLTSCIFSKSRASTGAYVITLAAANAAAASTELQTALGKLSSCSFNSNTTPAGALRIVYTGTAGTITADLSNVKFSGNTKDIYFQSTNATTLTLNTLNGTTNPLTTAVSTPGTGNNVVNVQGTYSVSVLVQNSSNTALIGTTATATGGISGTTMTLASVNSGTVAIGMTIAGSGVSANTRIVSGSGLSWVVNVSQTVTAGTALTMNGGPRVGVYRASDMAVIVSPTYTNGSGIVSGSATAMGNIIVRVRNSSGARKYFPQDISGSITAQGYDTTVTMLEDNISK